MTTNTNYTEHIKAEYGSIEAFEQVADNSDSREEFEFRHSSS